MVRDPDAREFTRANVNVEITLSADEIAATVRGQIRDVSANGVFVATTDKQPVGVPCEVAIQLTGDAQGPTIRAKGEVVRATDEGIAIRFTEIVGENSYAHLQRLVMHNAAETERVKQEFDDHLGIRRPDSSD